MRTLSPLQDPSANRPVDATQRALTEVPNVRQDHEVLPQTSPNRPQGRPTGRERDRLIVNLLPQVQKWARRLHARLPRSVSVEDLTHEGTIGLIEAIDRYDECRKVPLKLFVRQRVEGAMLDFLRSLDWVPRSVRRRSDTLGATRDALHRKLGRTPVREEMAKALEMPVAEYDRYVGQSEIRRVVSADTPVGPENNTPIVETLAVEDDPVAARGDRELRDALLGAVERLPEKEREAVVGFYLERRSLSDVGAALGVSESRASQLHRMGVSRLRYKIREHLID